MKGILKKATMSMLLCASLAPANALAAEPISTSVASTSPQFTDVDENHYAYNAILWAQQNGIVKGYADGTFKPNDVVTEAQFAKMLVNYFHLEDSYGDLEKSTTEADWSDTYYDALAQYSVPLNGYFDNTIRNQPVKRGVVAQALSYMVSREAGLNEAIQFLIDQGISTGQNPQYQDNLARYFGASNNLTRAQVVTFLYRMQAAALELNLDDSYFQDYTLDELAMQAKYSVDSNLLLPRIITGDALLPKEGLTLTYYPSFTTKEKQTFTVENYENTVLLSLTNSYGIAYYTDDTSLLVGQSDTDYVFFDVTLPIEEGKNIQDISYDWEKEERVYFDVEVESTTATVTVNAGTFDNVIVLRFPSGTRVYLAIGIGVIKSTNSDGSVITELYSIN